MKDAIDLTKCPEAEILFTSTACSTHSPATIIDAIQSTLVAIDQPNGGTGELSNDKCGVQQDDDAATVSEEDYTLETLWTLKAVEAVRIRDGGLHWCIVLEDNSIATDWFEETVVLGHKLSEYASYRLPVGNGTFVAWHRQWVTSDRVPRTWRRDYLDVLLRE